jgi:hypothetical protein
VSSLAVHLAVLVAARCGLAGIVAFVSTVVLAFALAFGVPAVFASTRVGSAITVAVTFVTAIVSCGAPMVAIAVVTVITIFVPITSVITAFFLGAA